METIIADFAAASGVSEQEFQKLLTELGLIQLLNEVRRLQAGEAFQEKRLVHQNEPIPERLIKQAFEALQEDY